LAARLCGKAQPGETLVSSSVAEMCVNHHFTDAGELNLKGFPHPVRAYTVVETP
jgi:class 3 adenylate cyclase